MKGFFLFIVVVILIVISACGSSTTRNPTTGNSNAGFNSVGSTPLGQSNSPNDLSPPNTASEENSKIESPMANRRKMVPVQQTGPVPPAPMRPAPENSEIATTMNNDGMVFETRVFKGNPQLAKVEMLWLSPTNKKVTIFLKSGKKVESPGERIDNLTTVSTAVLLEIAGVKAAEPKPADDSSRTPQKKRIQ